MGYKGHEEEGFIDWAIIIGLVVCAAVGLITAFFVGGN